MGEPSFLSCPGNFANPQANWPPKVPSFGFGLSAAKPALAFLILKFSKYCCDLVSCISN